MYEMLRLQFIIFSLIGIGCYARKTGIVVRILKEHCVKRLYGYINNQISL